MRNIRGAVYWRSLKADVFAILKAWGPPAWFLSLSANDTHWDDLVIVLLQQSGKPNTKDDIDKVSEADRIALLNNDPITAARYFSKGVQHFFMMFLYSVKHLIGVIVEHFWRNEFQNRVFPHIHSTQNAPYYENAEDHNVISSFLDRYVSSEIPAPGANEALRNKVLTLQVHKLIATCKKYDKKHSTSPCRFDFPHPPCEST